MEGHLSRWLTRACQEEEKGVTKGGGKKILQGRRKGISQSSHGRRVSGESKKTRIIDDQSENKEDHLRKGGERKRPKEKTHSSG